jgi:predicted PurR-regulated permease PerM
MVDDNLTSPSTLKIRQVILATLFVVMVGVALYLIIRFRVVLFILFGSIVLSTAITPVVEWLRRIGLPRAVGVILVYILIFGALIGFAFLAAPLIIEQSTSLSKSIPTYYSQFLNLLEHSSSYLIRQLALVLPAGLPNLLPASPPVSPESSAVEQVNQIVQSTLAIIHSLFTFIAVLLLGFYWTLDGERTIRSLLLFLPMDRRDEARDVIDVMQSKVGGFVFGQVIMCTTIGLMSLIAFLVIGLPYAFSLAGIAGVLEAVPLLGPTLGAIPAVLVALTTGGTHTVIYVIISTAIIQSLENHLLIPRVMNRSVGVHPVVTLMAFASLTKLFGLAGALLAVPIAAVVQILIDRFMFQQSVWKPVEANGRDRISLLRLEVQELSSDVRKQVREKDAEVPTESDHTEDAIERIADELDRILTHTQEKETE